MDSHDLIIVQLWINRKESGSLWDGFSPFQGFKLCRKLLFLRLLDPILSSKMDMTASQQFIIMTLDPTFGLVLPKHGHTFQDGNAAKKFIMIALTIFQIDNFTICPPPNSFDKEGPVIEVLFFNLLQFVDFGKIDFRRCPFTVGYR